MAFRSLPTIALFIVASAAAAIAGPAPLASDCLTPLLAQSGKNLYPTQFQAAGIPATSQVTVAQHFTIQYFDTYKIVNNTTPYNQETYVLYQCGTLPPSSANIPKGAKVFQIPLAAISVDDSTAVAYVKAVGLVNRVSFVTDTVIDACMQELSGAGCNKVSNVSSPLQGDLVSAFLTGSASSAANTIAITGYTDPGLLNRFEWIKYVAAFFNQEAVANALYNTTVTSYKSLAATVASIAPAVNSTSRPLVAWLAYFPSYGPSYPPSWSISIAQYKVDITQDAGGRMHAPADLRKYANASQGVSYSSSGSLSMTNQTRAYQILHEVLADVDVVIDETGYVGVRDYDVTLTNFLSTFGLTQTGDAELPFLKSQSLYRHDGITDSGLLNDWYEGAYTAPDKVLLDFVAILTPSAAPSGTVTRWVRNLVKQKPTIITASQCTTLRGCALTATPLCPSIYQACNGSIVYATTQQPCAPVCSTSPVSASPPPSPPSGATTMFASPPLLSLMAVFALLVSLTLVA